VLPIVPHAAPAQPDPLTVHVAAVLDVPVTEAENCCVAPVASEALLGLTVTTIPEATVTTAVADLLESATLVAITLTPAGEGATNGAE
jgi:hypothetical protein